MPIKHLVLSGGGPTGLLTYGAVSYLSKKGFWHLKDIESIYGCSVGAYMGVVFSLGYDLEWLDDYFIKRPWEKLVASSAINLVDVYEEKGLVSAQFITDSILPLLRGKDISEHITLAELYALNHIDIHLYATNINAVILEKVDLSHSTHPNLGLIKALRMTMAFPLLLQPVFEEGGCYIDGGLLNNFPLNDCIHREHCELDEILAFKNIWTTDKEKEMESISEKSSLLDFLLMVMKKTQATLDSERNQKKIKHTVQCLIEDLTSFAKWAEALSCEPLRKKLVEKGYKQAELFLAYLEAAGS